MVWVDLFYQPIGVSVFIRPLQPYLKQIDQNKQYTNFGPLVKTYEDHLAEIIKGKCVTLASGTVSLELAIAVLDLPTNARVLLPSFTFPATLLAILRCGLQPVFSDVDEDTWTLTPAIARRALQSGHYNLILPVASFGLALPSEDWDVFTQETGIPVIIDAAAALGSQSIGKTTNVIFSLHATKPLGIGEGGIFATMNPDMAERVRRMSNFGFAQGTASYSTATNAKISEYSAVVGLAQLQRWPKLLARRRSIWKAYRIALQGLQGIKTQPLSDLTPPAVLTVCLANDMEKTVCRLEQHSIETRRWYTPPLHRHPPFAYVDRASSTDENSLPVTENLYRNSLGLPFHTFLTNDQIALIVENLHDPGDERS